MCVKCKKEPPENGRKSCTACLAYAAGMAAGRRDEKESAGICLTSGCHSTDLASMRLCEKHLLEMRERARLKRRADGRRTKIGRPRASADRPCSTCRKVLPRESYGATVRGRRDSRCLACKALNAKNRRRSRSAAGLCGQCGLRPVVTKVACRQCGNKQAEANAVRATRLMGLGMCPRCGTRPPASDRRRCAPCLDYARLDQAARDARARARAS